MDEQTSTVILARVSSKAQEDEGYSLDSQLKLLKGYCENKGLRVVRTFKIAETASKDQSRKIFHEMLEYMEKNRVFHLAVEKTDRLTRNFKDAVAIDEWLEKDGNRMLHAVKENILLHKESKSDVKFMWNIHLAVAKKYTDNLREEAMKGWAEKLAQGWLPAPPPPGYVTVTQNGKRVHVPDPKTGVLMAQLFKKYLEPSESIRSVTDHMESWGIRTRPGRPYSKSNVELILKNPFYIGINRFDGKDYPGAQETLITKELFQQVQRKLHKGRPTVFKRHDPVFKNLIRCENCGGVVTWQFQKGRYWGACQRKTDQCRHRKYLREDKLEAIIKGMLARLVCPSQAVIQWVAESMRQEQKTAIQAREQLIASLQAQIERIERMDSMLYDDKLAGDISRERYEEKHSQLVTQKADARSKLDNAAAQSSKSLEKQLVLLELSQRAAELYDEKSPEQKRVIITHLFENMTSRDDSLSVEYTEFAKAIADRSEKSRKLMEDQK